MKKIFIFLVWLSFISMKLQAQPVLPGANGPIYAIKVYKTTCPCGSDGTSCCQVTRLIIGGQFTQVNSVPANNIAVWDGLAWHALGTGLNGAVKAIEAIPRGPCDPSPDIYVGGDFTDKGNALAKWNGASSTWSALGSGLSSSGFGGSFSPGFVTVNSLINIGGVLWVGGRFYSGGGVASPNIMGWNLSASQWGAIGSPAGINSPVVMVTSIDPGGTAIGLSTNTVPPQAFGPPNPLDKIGFYTFNGSTFVSQGRTPNMRAILASSGNFYAGHDQVSPQSFGPPTWEGTTAVNSGVTQLGAGVWELLGQAGPALPPLSSPWWPVGSAVSGWKAIGPVYATAQYNGIVYFGGSFSTLSGAYPNQRIADYAPLNNVFQWNTSSSTWSPLQNAPGSCSAPGGLGVNGTVRAMAADFDACTGQFLGIWFGGSFTSAGGLGVANLAFWNGTSWAASETPGPAAAITAVAPGNSVLTGPNGSTTLNGYYISAFDCDPVGTLTGADFYADGVLIGSASVPANPVVFWQPAQLKTYQLSLVVRDATGATATSVLFPYAVTSPPPPPAAPTALTTLGTQNHIHLTWIDNSTDESGYIVERSTDGVNFTQIGSIPFNSTSYDDFTVQAGISYYYRVEPVVPGVAPVYSNTAGTASLVNMGIKIAAGNYHSLAVEPDGTVKAWGQNTYGQVGDGTLISRMNPVSVSGLTGIKMVSAGSTHSLALTANGNVYAWGQNNYGQTAGPYPTFGAPYLATPNEVIMNGGPLNNVVYIAGGGASSYAVKSDGTVWAWGYNQYGQLGSGYSGGYRPPPQAVPGLSGVKIVAGGTYHVLALTSNGNVYAWGNNSNGQLGNGTTTQANSPVLIANLSNIVAISAGNNTSYALDNSGIVWAWGANAAGQLGLGTTTDVSTPTALTSLSGVDIMGIFAGSNFGQALASNGTLWAWGNNAQGQLGDGTTTARYTPVSVSFPDGSTSLGISGGVDDTLSIQADGTLRSWGLNFYGELGRVTGGASSYNPDVIVGF